MKQFSRRRYHRLSDLVRDAYELSRRRRQIRELMSGEVIDAGFRERLMLAVTEVNGCRYCSYAHARTALTAGLSEADVTVLAAGRMGGSPPDRIPAEVGVLPEGPPKRRGAKRQARAGRRGAAAGVQLPASGNR